MFVQHFANTSVFLKRALATTKEKKVQALNQIYPFLSLNLSYALRTHLDISRYCENKGICRAAFREAIRTNLGSQSIPYLTGHDKNKQNKTRINMSKRRALVHPRESYGTTRTRAHPFFKLRAFLAYIIEVTKHNSVGLVRPRVLAFVVNPEHNIPCGCPSLLCFVDASPEWSPNRQRKGDYCRTLSKTLRAQTYEHNNSNSNEHKLTMR